MDGPQPWHHGIAGDKAALLYILAGSASRAVPFLLFGAVALIWVLQ